jgi:hypothetical protein
LKNSIWRIGFPEAQWISILRKNIHEYVCFYSNIQGMTQLSLVVGKNCWGRRTIMHELLKGTKNSVLALSGDGWITSCADTGAAACSNFKYNSCYKFYLLFRSCICC